MSKRESGECLKTAAAALSEFGHIMEKDGKEFTDEELKRVAKAYFLATTGILALQMELDGGNSPFHIKITQQHPNPN